MPDHLIVGVAKECPVAREAAMAAEPMSAAGPQAREGCQSDQRPRWQLGYRGQGTGWEGVGLEQGFESRERSPLSVAR